MSRHAPSDPSLPAPLRDFLALYAEGRFWESHEVLEIHWRERGSDFYQGLILYASAWVHWKRANAHGVRAQLRKALERLGPYPSAYLGLDVAAIREHCRVVRRRVPEGGRGEGEGKDHASPAWRDRVAPLPLAVDAELLRGDEVELEA